MKTKADFVLDIVREAREDRSTNAAAKRTVTALRELGLSKEEIVHVMGYLDYCDQAGTPYGTSIKKCW